MEKWNEFCGVFCGVVAGLVIVNTVRAWAIAKVWWWFMTPWFHVAPLSWAEAFGVGSLFVLMQGYRETTNDKKWWHNMANASFYYVICVGIAWIAKEML